MLDVVQPPARDQAPTDLVGRLRSGRDGLTRSQQLLSDIILADIDAVLRLSIVDLANLADVSAPTVTRFCRRVGCDSYAEFRLRLAQSSFGRSRYLVPEQGPQSINEIAQVVLSGVQSTIYELFGRLDLPALDRAAEAITRARYVLAFGSGGSSSMIATETETRLFRLGIPVSASTDHQAQMMRAAGAPAGTVVIAWSMSGNNLPLAHALAAGGESGVTRIVATRSGSPVAAEADILIPIDREENLDIMRPTPGRYAFLAVLDILSQAVATRLGAVAVDSMRRIKHQLVLNRDKQDGQPLGD